MMRNYGRRVKTPSYIKRPYPLGAVELVACYGHHIRMAGAYLDLAHRLGRVCMKRYPPATGDLGYLADGLECAGLVV